MGMFQVRVRVANPSERSRFFEEDFWVDTGALYSFIPEGRLNEIGIRPLRTRELILADGRRDRRSLGEAVLTIPQLDESLTCPVVFAPADSLHLLGATALENFGVQADPTTQQLKPIAAVIGGFLASASRPGWGQTGDLRARRQGGIRSKLAGRRRSRAW
jgi:predicted aspartyl protease